VTAPMPSDPENAVRALDIIEFLTKFSGALLALWAFIAKVGKPYVEWRRRHMAELMREVLKEELAALARVTSQEELCAERLTAAAQRMEDVLDEQEVMSKAIHSIAETQDEMWDLLTALGLNANDRREGDERRVHLDDLLTDLSERRRSRRRRTD
jgi:hypothetical protein